LICSIQWDSLRRICQLSDGQRYRFAVARLCDSRKRVWVADEFASSLSPEIAAVVAKGLRRLARQHGTTVILAAPHMASFMGSLLPTKLIRLRWGGCAERYGGAAEWSEDAQRIQVKLANQSDGDLTDMVFEALDINGEATVIRHKPRLSSRMVWHVGAEKRDLREKTSLRVRSAQGVGDVAYLRCR
jgi:ABC-type methionine transport system ATPase subunit